MTTDREIDLLAHALGWPTYHRNFYAAGEDDIHTCDNLVQAGLMIKRPGGISWSGFPIYHVTQAGREAVAGAKSNQSVHLPESRR